MRQIDFTQQEKEAEREYKQNANAVDGRLNKRKKRDTGQVRMSKRLIRGLKMLALDEQQTMARVADSIVEPVLRAKGFLQNSILLQGVSPAKIKGRKAKLPPPDFHFPQKQDEMNGAIPRVPDG